MKAIVALFFCLSAVSAFADVPTQDFGFLFDRLPGVPLARKYDLGVKMREMHNTAICVYDFATQGGAINTVIPLRDSDLGGNCALPGKSIVRGGFIDVSTALLPTTSQLQIYSGVSATAAADGDLRTTTGASNMGAVQLLISPTQATVSTYIKFASSNSASVNPVGPYIKIKNTALTAGHFRLFIDYELGE